MLRVSSCIVKKKIIQEIREFYSHEKEGKRNYTKAKSKRLAEGKGFCQIFSPLTNIQPMAIQPFSGFMVMAMLILVACASFPPTGVSVLYSWLCSGTVLSNKPAKDGFLRTISRTWGIAHS